MEYFRCLLSICFLSLLFFSTVATGEGRDFDDEPIAFEATGANLVDSLDYTEPGFAPLNDPEAGPAPLRSPDPTLHPFVETILPEPFDNLLKECTVPRNCTRSAFISENSGLNTVKCRYAGWKNACMGSPWRTLNIKSRITKVIEHLQKANTLLGYDCDPMV